MSGPQEFLHCHQLPTRWADQPRFVCLQLGFGAGAHFLAAWAAWRDDPARCQRLIFVAVDAQPLRADQLQQALRGSAHPTLAQALLQAWPPLTTNLHGLSFADGRVTLLLAHGPRDATLRGLRVAADALLLDEDLAAWSPRALAALGRKAADGARLVAARLTATERDALVSAGFEMQASRGVLTVAHFSPRFAAGFATRALPRLALPTTDAVVLGAGMAGAAVAQALAQRGLQVTVLDRHAAPATGASGNAAGLFHGALHGRDGHYARLYRAAALHAQRCFARAIATQQVAGNAGGLLRLVDEVDALPKMQALLRQQNLPPDYVQAVDAAAASKLAGVPLRHPAWYFCGGGWLASADWVRSALAQKAVRFVGQVNVQSLSRDNGQWLLLDAQQRTVARSALLVLANGAAAAPLLAPLGHAAWPTNLSRGQVTQWHSSTGPALQMPVTGDGYVMSLPGGHWLCGATRDEVDGSDSDDTPRHADHVLNLLRMHRLTGLTAPADSADWQGRVGWRVQSADSLPIAGAVPLAQWPTSQRQDQVRLLPREPGLFVLTALGSRGLTWAPLLAELIAAQALNEPWPLEQTLADAVDPARWRVRAARASAA